MQRLVIPVSETTALHWKQASPERRAKLIQMFCEFVENEKKEPFSSETFSQLLDELSDKAVANGLTQDVLDEILHES